MQAISFNVDSDSAIKLHNVTAGYERNIVFSDLSLEITSGQFAGIVGPTASGKSTLLKIILGTHPVMSGAIHLSTRSIEKAPPRTIGYVPQLDSVDWSFPITVEEVITMGLHDSGRIWPWPSRAERNRVNELASRLGVYDCLRQHIANISGGERQRAFLARALINNPRLLVLDEPTSGVDIKTQHEVLHLLGDLNSEGITVLLTTHDLNAVASHLPWVICFNKGIVAQGRPYDIFTNEILTKTYGGDIVIVKYDGHFLIANSTPLHFRDRHP
ncbi:zinc/manganese transport system ATP-binding protein/zinc transport system ATP-binding protein [Nitrosomonas nitrosa]|jgi:zinc/manganese transport system ATP-binding protein|uniref:Zinc/manganese transport system ATP-binding protein/zinc transport system ATP-binding protein n=1 Tax=Nitrosomonas nitrosa TaxID=52442 RepID=A0A1I4PB57_9PROT|nr:metal ABC transporter ATP-binding protein [Nitrosomonas nitrosa]PTQ97071.1 zinc/manganese transport system ATP-binding protein/zinc transport system ATP-binding protein [Nitrosomonas nitrosa]CAE6509656.1 Zinc/manganese transport system ATP-binding protein/zinc transport system ATP-binding protein [Nitrosomonas nitrosa]SFM24806.1 zinc/manganese transport system ATP-binding protein/zinc transport system ATP-binding protein [Nitrosomonas nitrosa]